MKPFLQDVERGVFATRAPNRPNAIGLSIVELVRREGNVLDLDGVDILDGTPLLDIKPYTASSIGWKVTAMAGRMRWTRKRSDSVENAAIAADSPCGSRFVKSRGF